jgi:thiol-disulfide isomerase/thioredoxin
MRRPKDFTPSCIIVLMRSRLLLLLLVACKQEAPAPTQKLELVEAPGAGDIAPIVVDALASAGKDHKQLLVYVGAEWCEPCVRFHKAAESGQLDAELGKLRLLVFDADRDGDALDKAGYKYELIPLFAFPKPDGTSSGKQIEGAIKGDGAVAQIMPRLRELVGP